MKQKFSYRAVNNNFMKWVLFTDVGTIVSIKGLQTRGILRETMKMISMKDHTK